MALEMSLNFRLWEATVKQQMNEIFHVTSSTDTGFVIYIQ